MLKTQLNAGMLSIVIVVLTGGATFAQDYPSKPVRIVTSQVGGGSDFVARLIAQGLSDSLGRQVVVDNRPSGVIPSETVAKSPPDGYTLLVVGELLWTTPLLQKTTYDAVRDFAPITLVSTSPAVLVVHPSLPAKSVKDLIALAKTRPGALNYGSGATGSSSHLYPELFKSMAGVDMVRVAYKGGGPAIVDLIGGQVQLMFGSASSVIPHIKSDKLRALAVTSAQPSALLPGLPAIATTLPGYESVSIASMFAPAGTPAAIVNRLNQDTVRFLTQPDVKGKLLSSGEEVVASSPQAFAATIKSDIAKWSKVIKDAGIKVE